MTDPLGTTAHVYARVLYVMPHSPASEAGLERGDWISSINGSALTVNNYNELLNGDGITLTLSEVVLSDDDVQVWVVKNDVTIGASHFVEMEWT